LELVLVVKLSVRTRWSKVAVRLIQDLFRTQLKQQLCSVNVADLMKRKDRESAHKRRKIKKKEDKKLSCDETTTTEEIQKQSESARKQTHGQHIDGAPSFPRCRSF
jgi:hypothetical protein